MATRRVNCSIDSLHNLSSQNCEEYWIVKRGVNGKRIGTGRGTSLNMFTMNRKSLKVVPKMDMKWKAKRGPRNACPTDRNRTDLEEGERKGLPCKRTITNVPETLSTTDGPGHGTWIYIYIQSTLWTDPRSMAGTHLSCSHHHQLLRLWKTSSYSSPAFSIHRWVELRVVLFTEQRPLILMDDLFNTSLLLSSLLREENLNHREERFISNTKSRRRRILPSFFTGAIIQLPPPAPLCPCPWFLPPPPLHLLLLQNIYSSFYAFRYPGERESEKSLLLWP